MRPDGGQPRAFDAACPHEDVSLARRVFNGRTLPCTAHGWVFDGRANTAAQRSVRLARKPSSAAAKLRLSAVENADGPPLMTPLSRRSFISARICSRS